MKLTTQTQNMKKRKPNNNNDDNQSTPNKKQKHLKEIISLLLIEDQDKTDTQESKTISQQENSLIESNFKEKTQVLIDQYSDTQTHFSNLDQLDESHIRKSRNSAKATAVAVAVAVAMKGVNSSGQVQQQQPSGQHRRLWVKDRSQAWWDRCSHPDFPELEFRRAFRMRRDTFNLVCEELNSVVAKEDTMLRNAIPVQQRVAVCIWRLATGEPLRLVSKRFGLGISTCHKLVLEVCAAIKSVLMPKYLQWPNREATEKTKMEYEAISGIPDVVGAMYTTHIPIIAPKVNVTAYYNKRHTDRNQKTSYSITVQGVVNTKGVFTDVCIGWPGSLPDEKVLEQSALFQRANRGVLNGDWIVGSSGYPLTDWVLVPYTHQHLTWTQHAFNEKISDIQNVAKEAFARLKGRWSCLQKRTEVKLQDLPVVLGACCVLHNICEMRNEEIDPELKFQLNDDEMVSENTFRPASAMQARDNIAHNLLHHGLAGTAFL